MYSLAVVNDTIFGYYYYHVPINSLTEIGDVSPKFAARLRMLAGSEIPFSINIFFSEIG
jgi:hypothetical protein